MDRMVYDAEKLSAKALRVAAAYDAISPYGQAIIDAVIDNEDIYSRAIIREADRLEKKQGVVIANYLKGAELI